MCGVCVSAHKLHKTVHAYKCTPCVANTGLI